MPGNAPLTPENVEEYLRVSERFGYHRLVCVCDRSSDHDCGRFATQEDLLCDVCRAGCVHVLFDDATGSSSLRELHHIELRVVRRAADV